MADQYFGKYTGIVKDNRDGETLGQIQVSVPAIFPAEELMSARAALPYGFFFVPEVETKVWIEFEGGDPGLPIWSGVQYVPGEILPEARVNPPQKRVIKTPGGNLIILNDKSDVANLDPQDFLKNMNVIELGNARITIQSKGVIEIKAPTVIINDRIVAPQPRPL